MDNLRTLIEKGQYDVVLSITEEATDRESLFARIAAFTGLGRLKEAEELLLKERDDLYETDPLRTLKVAFELRFALGEFEEADKDIEYYGNKPYVGQSVEEILRELPSIVRKKEAEARSGRKAHDEEEIIEILEKGSTDEKELEALNALQKMKLDPYIEPLKAFLLGDANDMLKVFALLLLVADGYRGEVKISKKQGTFNVIPADLEPPYAGKKWMDFVNKLGSSVKDPSLVDTALNLLDGYAIDIFPLPVIVEGKEDLLRVSLLALASDYLKAGLDVSEMTTEASLDETSVSEMKIEIAKVIESATPIKA